MIQKELKNICIYDERGRDDVGFCIFLSYHEIDGFDR
jgi:hypothetical protein